MGNVNHNAAIVHPFAAHVFVQGVEHPVHLDGERAGLGLPLPVAVKQILRTSL